MTEQQALLAPLQKGHQPPLPMVRSILLVRCDPVATGNNVWLLILGILLSLASTAQAAAPILICIPALNHEQAGIEF